MKSFYDLDEFVQTMMILCISVFGLLITYTVGNITITSLALTNGYNEVQKPGQCGTMWQKDDKQGLGEFLFKGGN